MSVNPFRRKDVLPKRITKSASYKYELREVNRKLRNAKESGNQANIEYWSEQKRQLVTRGYRSGG